MNAWIIIREGGEILFITLQGTSSFRPRKSLKRHKRLAACGRAASSLGSLQTALFTLAPTPLSLCTVSIDRSAEAQRRTQQSRNTLWVMVVKRCLIEVQGVLAWMKQTTQTHILSPFFLLKHREPQVCRNQATPSYQAITYYHYPYNTNRHCRYACVGKP